MKKFFLLVIYSFSVTFVYSKLDINLEISFTYFAYFIPVHKWIVELKNVIPNTLQSVKDHNCTFSFLYKPEDEGSNRGLLHLFVVPNDSSNHLVGNYNKLEAKIPLGPSGVEYGDDFMYVKCLVVDLS